MDLLESDSSSEDEEISFKINENYAKNYDKWRKKEEKQKLIDKYGDAETSSSSSEEEEIRSTPQIDKDWLRAYAVVRFRQSRLYKEGEKFFHEIAEPVVKKKEKALTLKDHERKFILEKGGVESDDESKPQRKEGKSYFEEQEEIKKSFKDALADSSEGDSDEESDGLLVKRQKTAEEEAKEENEYLEWLKGERDELEDKDAAEELAPLKAYWNDPNLSEKERVLRDYILHNGYMDQEDSDSSDDDEVEQPNFDAEEDFLEQAEEYEQKYNFRHEEPGGDEIKSYPRVIENSVRTKDTRRAEQRKRKMEKKRQEQEQKKEEIKLLQKLQKEEKKEKLEAIRKIGSNPILDYDLDADFDPKEHNRIMQKFFNEEYYGDMDDTGDKPVFEYDAAIDEEPDEWWDNRLQEEKGRVDDEDEDEGHKIDDAGHDDNEPDADDPNFIMDADYDPTCDYKAEKTRKKKFGKAFAKKLPVFDPTTKTFDEYMDEYLKDKIDKLPFPYREVEANDFGLHTEEILKAKEKELNAWVSVKKMSQYRSKQEELADKRKFAARARNESKKLKVLISLLDKPGNNSTENEGQKKKKKKRRKKKKGDDAIETAAASDSVSSVTAPSATEPYLAVTPTAAKGQKRKRVDSEEVPTTSKKKNKGDGSEFNMKQESMGKKIIQSSLSAASPGNKQPKKQKKEKGKQQTETANSTINGCEGMVKKKKKKTKLQMKNSVTAEKSDEMKNQIKKQKKNKKKKVSISNFGTKTGVEKSGQSMSSKGLEKQLSKVMSASRLSKFGIGSGAAKTSSKKKKKKNQMA